MFIFIAQRIHQEHHVNSIIFHSYLFRCKFSIRYFNFQIILAWKKQTCTRQNTVCVHETFAVEQLIKEHHGNSRRNIDKIVCWSGCEPYYDSIVDYISATEAMSLIVGVFVNNYSDKDYELRFDITVVPEKFKNESTSSIRYFSDNFGKFALKHNIYVLIVKYFDHFSYLKICLSIVLLCNSRHKR